MFLTLQLLRKAGWRPRSLSVPGRQWIGKHRRIRAVTKCMNRTKRLLDARIANVESLIEFPYLTVEENVEAETIVQKEAEENRVAWQRRILGKDVFGLGVGKPSMLDHLMVTDTRRYSEVKTGALSNNTVK